MKASTTSCHKNIEILEGAEHGVDEGPGVLHVAVVGKHLLFEVGPCLPVGSFVEDGPVFGSPLSVSEQGGRGVGIGGLI